MRAISPSGRTTPLPVVVVSFVAFHGDPYARDPRTGHYVPGAAESVDLWGPTLRLLASPRSDLRGRVSDWYFLCHPDPTNSREAGRSAVAVVEDVRKAVQAHVPEAARPRMHSVVLSTERPPTDHEDMYRCVRESLHKVRREHPLAELVLMLSAGTSAMHAVLLLAGTVGVVDGPLRLIQVERGEGARRRPESPIEDVTLRIESVLRVAMGSRPAATPTDVAPTARYDRACSPALRATLAAVGRAALVPFPLLLRGERGVGKSTIAGFVRAAGPFRRKDRDGNWPSLACGQFSDSHRVQSELCGYKKGAFTDAKEDRKGLFEQANGDTLFLDEIHDLTVVNQRLLIRAVEEGRYYAAGDATPRQSKFRLICGTNLPDSQLRERLSADFYDRIRDIEIEIPPLRECREDLPWMWEHAWRTVATQASISPGALGAAEEQVVVAGLARHSLPGNWRDLRRVAVRLAMLVGPGGRRVSSDAAAAALAALDVTAGGEVTGASGRPRLGSGHQERFFRELEKTLGSGLDGFWSRCEDGGRPAAVLQELLGDRSRARRAAKLIEQAFPAKWARVVPK